MMMDPQNSPAPPPFPASPPPSLMLPAQGYGMPAAVSADDMSMGMLCHLLAIFTGFLGPLILWLVKKDGSRFVDHHGREALNFQLTVLLAMVCLGSATFVLMFVFIGILLIPVLMLLPLFALIVEILAAIAAQRGEWYRYPCCIRFV